MADSRSLELESGVQSEAIVSPLTFAPLPLFVGNAILVTPAVIVPFIMLKSVWLAYASLFCLWVIAPLAICSRWQGSRRLVSDALRRGLEGAGKQFALALPLVLLTLGTGVLLYRYLALPLGLDLPAAHVLLAECGLTSAAPFNAISALGWLDLLNPVMEEGFWRLFMMALLRPRDVRDGFGAWWGPTLAVSAMYASYHVPIVFLFLPPSVVFLFYVILVGLGIMLQTFMDRFGLLLPVLIHFAYDTIACIIIADVIWMLEIAIQTDIARMWQ